MTESSVALVPDGGTVGPDSVAAQLIDLLGHGWDAHVVCEAPDPSTLVDLAALPPDVRWRRVHPPPAELRQVAPRPGLLGSALRTAARHPRAAGTVWRGRNLNDRYRRAVLLALRPQALDFASVKSFRRLQPVASALRARVVVGIGAEQIDALDHGLLLGQLARADGVYVETRAAAELLCELGLDDERVAVIPPVHMPAAVTERKPGLLRVLSVGPLVWEAGYEHALAAVARLTDLGVACHYRIVGSGEFAPAVSFARHQLGVEHVVDVLEPQGDRLVREQLAWADVLLSPAVAGRAIPAIVQSAQAAGLPVVRTAPPPATADGAITAPRRDAEALAACLASLAGDPGLRRRVVDASRRSLGGPIDAEARHELMRQLYARALERP